MDILKSSRHAKIAGDFGEALVLYWLSKYGFECAKVDHTGIDLIASSPYTDEVVGISVKSRTRDVGSERDALNLPKGDFEKAQAACDAFGCVPYFAIVIDAKNFIRVFLLSMQHLLREEYSPVTTSVATWKMNEKYLKKYYADPDIKIFELEAATMQWWSKEITH